MPDKEATTVEKPKRTIDGKKTNPAELEFPFDEHGFTTILRKEGVRAAGRIRGDERKLEVFLNTLRVLADHARIRVEDQKVTIEREIAGAKNRAKAEYARNEADKKREVKRLEGLLAAAKAAVSAKKADSDEGGQ